MSAQAGEVGALADEVARLSAEVTKLGALRDGLQECRYVLEEYRVRTEMLIGLGRCLEREDQAARQTRRRPRSHRPQHLRPVGGAS